jgi:hypothetical protein
VCRLTRVTMHGERETCDVDLSQIVAVTYSRTKLSDTTYLDSAGLYAVEGFLIRVVDNDTFRAAWKRECELRSAR